jgi:fumarate hydratase class II
VRQGIERVGDSMPRLGQIPLGGTATGTGLNTHPEFAAKVRELLARETGLEISAPADPFEAQAARDGIVEASGALKTVAVSLTKSRTTSASSAPARARGSPRSRCPSSRREARSCRAR